MKLYVYCVAEGVESIAETVRGVSNAPVRLLNIEGLAVLVSNLEADTVPVNRENVLAHAAVVRSVMDSTTPLPFRFGTFVSEAQLRSYLETRKPALETKLAHVRDCVEMSVKIIWELTTEVPGEQQPLAAQVTGTAFLAEKRREILGDERRSAAAKEISTWLHQSLSGLTRDEQVTVRPNEKLVVAASHLVERPRVKQYQDKVAEVHESRPDLHFLLSGPWPPYSFVNIELEFKTQFGVS
ncbi:MAG TPA: GvpL/GvpF family gas vesicle protein [Pyrinomonadaceae bacterium]|nr:GvpL/GvpF family gas vesicle protein [Pyrinomonadaceae bacterium]